MTRRIPIRTFCFVLIPAIGILQFIAGCAPAKPAAGGGGDVNSAKAKALLQIETLPDGANVTLSSRHGKRWDGARTPATFRVDPSLDIILEITLDGYRPVSYEVRSVELAPDVTLSLFFDMERVR